LHCSPPPGLCRELCLSGPRLCSSCCSFCVLPRELCRAFVRYARTSPKPLRLWNGACSLTTHEETRSRVGRYDGNEPRRGIFRTKPAGADTARIAERSGWRAARSAPTPPRADSGSQCASAFAQQSRAAGADAGTRSQSPDSGSEQAWYAEGPAGKSGRSSPVHTRTHSAC
jgi:hypothetical protein